MNNKVKFLRGTSDEYVATTKDSDTIYFTTDDGKLYIGDKEISGGKGGGSSGGMKLIGRYAVKYSTEQNSGESEEIELPIDLYENNRTLLIRTTINDDSSTHYTSYQNYSMIKIEIPYDIYDTGKLQCIYSPFFSLMSSSNDAHFILYYRPKTNKFSITTYIKSYSGEASFDVYDMGVIE